MPFKPNRAIRDWLEFAPAWMLLKLLGLLPRKAALASGRLICLIVHLVHGRLRRTANRNLCLAMPELHADGRKAIITGVFENLGRLLAEFSRFPKMTKSNVQEIVIYDGFENYRRAAERGRGVLFLTGHLGAWELCAFAQGLYGFPLSFLVRPIDNPLVDALIKRYRELSGNQTINKNESVRKVLTSLKNGRAVGFLIDVNTLEDEGEFCEFFGIPACSTTGLATFALRTNAPVVPGFIHWDERLKRHRLTFEPEVNLIRTGDFKDDVRSNTALFTSIIENHVRRRPEQWLWVHKRWRTRPQGERGLYDASAPANSNPPTVKSPLNA